MIRICRRIISATIVVTAVGVCSALSVNAQDIPSGDSAGAQGERFEKASEIREKAVDEKVKKPEIEMGEEAEQKPAPEGPSFLLKKVEITGSSLFTDEELMRVYGPYLGKTQSFGDLVKLADKIKGSYREKGYLTTIVYIPEQEIVDGKVEIRVMEGKVGGITVDGNRWFSDYSSSRGHAHEAGLGFAAILRSGACDSSAGRNRGGY